MTDQQVLAAIAIVCILVFLYKLCNSPLYNVERIRIDDGNYYNVQEDYVDKEKAARMMSLISDRVAKVLKYMKTKRAEGEYSHSKYLDGVVHRLLTRWNPEELYESPPSAPGTSYTVAKGEKTVFCLRDDKKENLHELDDILFVALHELSHMGDLNWNHKRSFWEIFKFVLHEAKEAKIYEPIDYVSEPVNYCGLHVNYNPFFDANIKEIY